MFCILGTSNCLTNRIYAKLKARGKRVAFINPGQFPFEMGLCFNTQQPMMGHFQNDWSRNAIPFEEIEGFFWWFYAGIDREVNNGYEVETALLSCLAQLECTWVNPPEAVFQHRFKGLQLKNVQSLGVLTPDTLIGNDPGMVAEFFERHHGQVIMKNVSDTGVPQKVTPDMIEGWTSGEFVLPPATFQPFIEGTDVRVHVVGSDIYASEVSSEQWVSKIDHQTTAAISLSKDLQEQCFLISKTLGMVWTGIDFRKTPQGDYYFLEANPSPQYPIYEDRDQHPISESIVRCLLSNEYRGFRRVWV
jgi:glutathione synthase/RimK-type ligase-like ATP-grasp enzyme